MSQLSLANIINISVSAANAGLGSYNTSNIALFTRAVPGGGFGDDGFKIYKSPSEVALDFGSSSDTAQMATAIFSQKPNILAGGGYLVVVPFLDAGDVTAVQTVTPSEAPASGAYKLNYDGDVTGSIAFDASAGTIQTAVRTLTGLGSATVTGTLATLLTITMVGVSGPVALLTVTDDSLQTAEPENVSLSIVTTVPGTVLSTETIAEAITRTKDLVQYFGILVAEITSGAHQLLAAAVVQTLNKIAFWPQIDAASVDSGGDLDDLTTGNLHQNRGLLYIGGGDNIDALLFAAAYAGRGLSTDFSGSNTTQTMHLKDLIGIQPDSGMNQTILNKCQDAGADVYASFQGVAKTFTSGANMFFDQVYNQQWFVGALEVAGFNLLAQSSTKLPQTEQGISLLKAAYRTVCQAAANNQYAAPGTWTSPETFGNLNDFLRNVGERGFYIYSSPISQQLKADREARVAPLIQIALKEAGAVQSSNVIVYVNP